MSFTINKTNKFLIVVRKNKLNQPWACHYWFFLFIVSNFKSLPNWGEDLGEAWGGGGSDTWFVLRRGEETAARDSGQTSNLHSPPAGSQGSSTQPAVDSSGTTESCSSPPATQVANRICWSGPRPVWLFSLLPEPRSPKPGQAYNPFHLLSLGSVSGE